MMASFAVLLENVGEGDRRAGLGTRQDGRTGLREVWAFGPSSFSIGTHDGRLVTRYWWVFPSSSHRIVFFSSSYVCCRAASGFFITSSAAVPRPHPHHPYTATANHSITMAKKSHEAAHNENVARQRQPHAHDYGGNPLAHIHSTDSARLPAFGGAAQPGLYKPPDTKIANPAPLGLSGFALTTFLLSCVNLGVRGLATPTIVIAPALAYGGFVQLLAGMWEIAVGESLP